MKIYKKDGLKYVDEGKGQVLLLFHGWGVSPFSCQNLIRSLASKYRVIAPFFRSFSNFGKDEKVIRDLVSEQQKIIVVGHSAGGISAIEFCSKCPEKIKALVLMDSLGAVVDKDMSKWRKRWFKESLDIFIHPDDLSTLLIKDFLYQVHNPKKLLKDAKYIINADVKLSANFPILILWGKEDDLIPIENGYNLQKALNGAKLKVIEGNHYWFLKRPQIFMEELNNFL